MILSAGEALFDMIGCEAGSDGARDAFLPVVGGSPLNVALGLVRLGRPAGYLTRLSRDYFGDKLMNFMRNEGIDSRFVRRAEGEQATLAFVATGADGHPVYSFYAANAADRNMRPSDLPSSLPPEVTAVHFGSISLVLEPTASTLIDYMAVVAHDRAVSLDPNIRASLIGDRRLWLERFARMLPHVDLIKASAEDVAWIEGPDADITDVARAWSRRGPHIAVVTSGGDGAVVAIGGDVLRIPAAPVAVVDTVGAGDTFQAALLAGLDEAGLLTKSAIRTVDLPRMADLARFAATAAAITCSRRGADLPTRADVLSALNDTSPQET